MKATMRSLMMPVSLLAMAVLPAEPAAAQEAAPDAEPPGRPTSARTGALEAGATVLQRDAPADALNVYLVGFHPLKDEPAHQFEAHHFCNQVNEDFMQCVLFDGNTAEARLNGVEYIVSARLFEKLPEAERTHWHPHNGEILSAQLVAPGIPAFAEHELMKGKINSYGKTWHTWNTGSGGSGDALPVGAPRLAWSFNRFGEADPALIEARDRALGVDTEERRRGREDLIPLAEPQHGVDALQGRFSGPTRPIPGVEPARDDSR
ncbi:MAG TPA: OBAP family protein [Pseudomonadales bacterium]